MRLVYLTVLLLAGCSFVQLTDGGRAVVQAGAGDVANCESLGVVSATTQSKVVLERGSEKVAEELIVLARNQAATLGANAIVPIGPIDNGSQNFRAYRCSPG